jgi:hypothetical protein
LWKESLGKYKSIWEDCLENVGASTSHKPKGLPRPVTGIDLPFFFFNLREQFTEELCTYDGILLYVHSLELTHALPVVLSGPILSHVIMPST